MYGRSLDSPEKLLAKYWHVPRLAEALSQHGLEVSVIQAFGQPLVLNSRGITINTVAATRQVRIGNADMNELTDFEGLRGWLREYDPDVVHFFGLTVRRPLRQVLGWAERNRIPVVTSFHGGSPRRNPLIHLQERQLLRRVSGFIFSAEAHAHAWLSSGVMRPDARLAIAPEVSSPFSGVPRQAARNALGLSGGPVFAWSGRLSPVKDPLTALRGFKLVCDRWPQARLLMAFETAELLAEVKAFLDGEPPARKGTTLLGRLPHEQMEILFSAADFFLQTSVHEIGSNSLVEAMSCGAIPLITDIPSFRVLTRDVEHAQLFPCGDSSAVAAAVERAVRQGLPTLSARVRSDFQEHLAYPKLAGKYIRVFEAAVAAKSTRPAA